MYYLNQISPDQARAARSHLKWLQEDLHEYSGVSVTTIRAFENGESITPRNIVKLRTAFEKGGLEFTEDDGVKRRNGYLVTHNSSDSCDKLLDDMLQTIEKRGGDILCIISSQSVMVESSGLPRRTNLERLGVAHEIADVKCVISESSSLPLLSPSFECRSAPQSYIGFPHSKFIYGNKYVDIVPKGQGSFIVAIYDIEITAQAYTNHFYNLWDVALSLKEGVLPKSHRAKTAGRGFASSF